MRRNALIRVVLIVVAVALAGGGVLYWRGLIGHPVETATAGNPKTPGAKPAAKPAVYKPVVLPSDAPKIASDADREVIDPFVLKMEKVNALAHKPIVTNAEYHDTDGGQRYFIGVVSSCKDLDAIWPIKKGVLASRVEGPLNLKSEFSIFAFAEYYQQGQWGVAACDNTI
jgi:hypothetical protein